MLRVIFTALLLSFSFSFAYADDEKIKDNNIETVELIKKVERCMSQIKGIENDKNQQIAEIQLNGF